MKDYNFDFAGKLPYKSGRLIVIDPCYIPDPGLEAGVYIPTNFFAAGDIDVWMVTRSGMLSGIIICQGHHGWITEYTEPAGSELLSEIGVDSGQIMLGFENDMAEWTPSDICDFENPVTHYDRCGATTLNDPGYGLVDGKFFVSATTYGDGSYKVFQGYKGFLIDLGDIDVEEEDSDAYGDYLNLMEDALDEDDEFDV